MSTPSAERRDAATPGEAPQHGAGRAIAGAVRGHAPRADRRRIGAHRLDAAEVTLAYGPAVVVEEASIPVQPGRVTALIGPNGSGKSTLLRALARLHRPRAGRILLTDTASEAEPREISVLSGTEFARTVTLFTQSRPAVDGLTVREIVAFGRHPYRRAFAGLDDADRAAVEAAMELTGVAGMAERSAGALSGGELQRVWLAVCLAQETGVLLLDEPTNHLDLRYQMETLGLVRDLVETRGTAIGIVLHDLDHAARVADTVVLMDRGRVRASGPPEEVLTGPLLSEVYEIPIEVTVERPGGRLRIDPIGRPRRPAD
ncbi:ABC transporter ATP-binding protein [Mycetocola reblochoni]|uniref:Ferric hydroxamate ABC transporter (TC 3.A.1.14.3), ATP-binding protein FhuC n=1 Tax=Mycetocola reblochoni REB411 TaxID=1255698 RepID=A0A1R4JI17_9MICO|nr:Ferric hydroxamate ABC transporter (TC 3.A.1.14.3), ATP-binding protein FhuC [Mycetocola reblochoni REB411]